MIYTLFKWKLVAGTVEKKMGLWSQPGPARPGRPRPGPALPGPARPGSPGPSRSANPKPSPAHEPGAAQPGPGRPGPAWPDLARPSLARLGQAPPARPGLRPGNTPKCVLFLRGISPNRVGTGEKKFGTGEKKLGTRARPFPAWTGLARPGPAPAWPGPAQPPRPVPVREPRAQPGPQARPGSARHAWAWLGPRPRSSRGSSLGKLLELFLPPPVGSMLNRPPPHVLGARGSVLTEYEPAASHGDPIHAQNFICLHDLGV